MISDDGGSQMTALALQGQESSMRWLPVLEQGGLLGREAVILEPLGYTWIQERLLVQCHRNSIWMMLARDQARAMAKGTAREAARDTTSEVVRAPAVDPVSDGEVLQGASKGMTDFGQLVIVRKQWI